MLEFYDLHKGMKFGSEPKVGGERIAAVVKGYSDADVGKVCSTNSVLPWLEEPTPIRHPSDMTKPHFACHQRQSLRNNCF